LELYTEEIVEELLERIDGVISLDVSLEYSEALDEVSLEYRWIGDTGNPLEDCKEEIREAIFGKLIVNSVFEKNRLIIKV
ncbi:MAG: hypothetical protein K6F39_08950, partial [Lachnospiraceae bacterium]|nr:hypothetical protein [Lachnospiraceae bacterium]